jgi:Flp pilus assembly protein TadB
MVLTIVLGLVLLSLILLALALNSLASRIRPLRRAARRLSWRAEQAQQLQVKAMVVQDRVADLQREIEATQANAAARTSNAFRPD